MLSLRCRLLQYAVFVVMARTFFRYFLFHVMASRFLSSSKDEIRQLLEEKDSKNKKRTFFRHHVYFLSLQCIIKQLSDSVFVICKIINVSPSARLITLTSTLIIPHITNTSSNNCLIFPLEQRLSGNIIFSD